MFFPDFNSCRFDPAAANGVEMIGHQKTWNAFGQGRFQINSDWQAYVTGLYAHDEVDNVIQPSPISDGFGFGPDNAPATVLIQPSSPFYPHALAAARPASTDNRSMCATGRTRTVCAASGTPAKTARRSSGSREHFTTGMSTCRASTREGKTTEDTTSGYEDYRILLPILNSGNVNLFGTNTPEVVSLLQTANFNGNTLNGKSTSYGAGAKTSGDVWKLPAGR